MAVSNGGDHESLGWPRRLWSRITRRQPRRSGPPDIRGRSLGESPGLLYRDDPTHVGYDLLNREQLSARFADTIKTVSERTPSAVVALVGPWGSGKTSLLTQITAELSRSDWHVGRHNPWHYADYTSAVMGFFGSLRGAVPRDVLANGLGDSLSKFVANIAPIGGLGSVLGADMSGALAAIGKLLGGEDDELHQVNERVASALTRLDHPVLIVLDDLDRLTPDELLVTFKLVRLIGVLPNVYYLLGYDESTLLETITKTDLVGTEPGRARKYLEKIVQVRLEIPPLDSREQGVMADALVAEVTASHAIVLSADQTRRLSSIWQECLALYLDQPRSLKKLFTQVDAVWPDVAGEVDFVDFVAITFLRVFERNILSLVEEERDELLQVEYFSFPVSRRDEPPADRWRRWLERIEKRGAQHPHAIANLLSYLFVTLQGARNNMSYGHDFNQNISDRQGVGSSEYFNRYIRSGLSESEVSDRELADIAASLRSGDAGNAAERLERVLDIDAGAAFTRLRRQNKNEPLPPATLLPILGDRYLDDVASGGAGIGLTEDRMSLMLAGETLDAAIASEASAVISEMLQHPMSRLIYAAEALRIAVTSQGPVAPWAEQVRAEAAQP